MARSTQEPCRVLAGRCPAESRRGACGGERLTCEQQDVCVGLGGGVGVGDPFGLAVGDTLVLGGVFDLGGCVAALVLAPVLAGGVG
jgi:hypothetical protein